jgi:metallophosphoesterase (TIGR00282 family)
MNILFLGDIVGSLGRAIIADKLAGLKKEHQIDFTIANGENTTHGKGLSLSHYKNLKSYGIDAITMGNHFFRLEETIDKNNQFVDMIRPLNLNSAVPGLGSKLFQVGDYKVRVTNLMGRVFIEGADSNPFDALDNLIKQGEHSDIHIVDFHAEATGEKMALAKAFDGKVTAVLGTHTHVQTNDARILPNGTGFISDAGMCGFNDGILGVSPDEVITHTWKGLPSRFLPPEEGNCILSGVILSVDPLSGKTISIVPVTMFEEIKKSK